MLFIRNRALWQLSATAKATVYLMSGVPPTDAASLKAAVDMTDLGAIHNASIGNLIANEAISYNGTPLSGIVGSKSTFTQPDTNTVFKNGAMPLRGDATKYQYMPARIFRVDGKPLTPRRCTPQLFSSPHAALNTWSPNVYVRDNLNDPAATAYQLEFDRPVPVAGFYWYGGNNAAGLLPTNISLQYQDSNGVWQTVASSAVTVTAAAIAASSTVTASNFRIIITMNPTVLLYATFYGIALYGTTDLPPIPVPDITWAILVPHGIAPYDVWDPGAYAWHTSGTRYAYVPAIVDSAGDAAAGKPLVMTAATGLTTQSHPSLMNYIHSLGVLK